MSNQEEFKGFQTNSDTDKPEQESGSAAMGNDPWADAGAVSSSSPATAATPDLDQSLPSLSGSTSQKLNKKGLVFLGCAAIVAVLMASVVYKKIFSGSKDSETPVAKEEVIDMPNRPELPRLPPADTTQTAMPQDLPQLPDMTSSAPLSEIPMGQTAGPGMNGLPNVAGIPPIMGQIDGGKTITLAERRATQSGSVYGGGGGGFGAGGGGAAAVNTAGGGGLFGGEAGNADAATANPVAPTGSVRRIRNPDALLVQGTYIRCALDTKIVSDVPGFTACVVTDPVYSMNGRKLLIARGSRVIGIYKQGDAGSLTDRVAIIWNRVVTPNGRDIELSSPGIDRLGGAGHPGQLDQHWGQRLGAALLVSMTADVFNYAGVKWGPTVTTTTKNSDGSITTSEDTFDSKTADVISKMPDQILSKTMNRQATVTINQGTILNIFAARDIDFSTVLD